MVMRRVGLALAVLAGAAPWAGATLPVSAQTTTLAAASQPRLALGDPSTNVAPSPAMLRACVRVGPALAAQQACESLAVAAIDAARASEGVGPMSLPTGFLELPPALQLLTLADLERADRGLAPITALSPSLDELAQQGADTDTDPPLPPNSQSGSNWAGGTPSTLLMDFEWMYDDGLGSVNGMCTPDDQIWCWDHRHNILGAYTTPILMGAATDGLSAAEEFVGRAAEPTIVIPTWADIRATIPVGISSSATSAVATPGVTASSRLSVWASGRPMNVRFAVAGGSSAWAVSSGGCDLQPGALCTVTLDYHPTSTAPESATLVVQAPGGDRTVALRGTAPTPSVVVAATENRIVCGTDIWLSATLRAGLTGTPLAGQPVDLESWNGGERTWNDVAPALTGAGGIAWWHLDPSRRTRYRVTVGGSTEPLAASASLAVTVGWWVSADVAWSHPPAGHKDFLAGAVRPGWAHQPVFLDRWAGRHWQTIASAWTAAGGAYRFSLPDPTPGTERFLVVAAATSTDARGSSPAVTVHVAR